MHAEMHRMIDYYYEVCPWNSKLGLNHVLSTLSVTVSVAIDTPNGILLCATANRCLQERLKFII